MSEDIEESPSKGLSAAALGLSASELIKKSPMTVDADASEAEGPEGSPESWGVEQVGKWLDAHHLSMVKDKLASNEVVRHTHIVADNIVI